MRLPNGNLFIFDNGFNRNFGSGTSNYSRAVEYRIDESAMEVRQIWEYGSERGSELYSPIISDVDLLENSNRLMTSGILFGADPHAKITEITYPDKTVAFEMSVFFKNAESGGSFSWGDFDLMYRAEKRKFYN